MRVTPRPARILAAAMAAAAVTISACGTATATAHTAAPTPPLSPAPIPAPTPSPAPSPAPSIPATPAGDQLRWMLDASSRAPIAEAELREHLAAAFLAAVPPTTFNQVLAAYAGLRLDSIVTGQERSLVARVTSGATASQLAILVDADGKISGARFTPVVPPAPASWKELDQRLRRIAPGVGFLAAELGRDGTCRPIHGVAPGTARPLGSMFKLYVLGAVAGRIREGAFGWDTAMTITPELKSLPSGQLQDRPDNSRVSVLDAAKLMIAVSDNTGADLLAHRAGRAKVEKQVRTWSGQVKRNKPFLTTRELFALKGHDYPSLARHYLSLGTAGRRAYLSKVVDQVPRSEIAGWPEPRDPDTLEWFASPGDVCRAYAGLARSRDPRIGQVMSQEDAGLDLPAAQWPTVWYKGGSEPGVLSMGYLARTASGHTYVVTTMSSDPKAALPEGQVLPELLSLTRGAFALASAHR